ncbi:hypothetical protein VCR12J2_1410001 [Vibrio coralliirubri]|nr:hypothetical protein VCR12J2_1410001 [Vibrio coralliirubri]
MFGKESGVISVLDNSELRTITFGYKQVLDQYSNHMNCSTLVAYALICFLGKLLCISKR